MDAITPLPVTIVQAQLEAYNRRDLGAFCALFAADAEIFELGTAAPSNSGIDAIRTRYAELFAQSPALHSTVLTRTVLGRVVVDLERISGRLGSPVPIDMLAIYEVIDSRIRRVHFVRP